MTQIEFQAAVGSAIRLLLQVGLGAWLTTHGVADTEAFAALFVMLATFGWSLWSNKRKLKTEPPKTKVSGL